jgi:hypothetical protein
MIEPGTVLQCIDIGGNMLITKGWLYAVAESYFNEDYVAVRTDTGHIVTYPLDLFEIVLMP